MANIRQNISVALGLKAVFLVTTMVGISGLWPAILADTGAADRERYAAARLERPVTSRERKTLLSDDTQNGTRTDR